MVKVRATQIIEALTVLKPQPSFGSGRFGLSTSFGRPGFLFPFDKVEADVSRNGGVLFVGVLIIRAPLFGIYFKAIRYAEGVLIIRALLFGIYIKAICYAAWKLWWPAKVSWRVYARLGLVGDGRLESGSRTLATLVSLRWEHKVT